MIDHAQLEALLAVERYGGFVAAAERIGLSASALSQRVKLLEQRLGLVLVHRGRPIRLTDSGLRLCRYAETIEQMEGQVLQAFSPDVIGADGTIPRLKVVVDHDSAATWLPDFFDEDANSNDARLIEFELADQDRSIEEMKAGHALAGVSSSPEAYQGYKARSLGTFVYRAAASPDCSMRYRLKEGDPAAVTKAPAIGLSATDDRPRDWVREAYGWDGILPTHVIPDALTVLEACRRSVGWSVFPTALIDDEIAQGKLVDLEPGAVIRRRLYWHVSTMAEAALAGVTRRVMRVAQAYLQQGEDPSVSSSVASSG